MTDIPVCPRHKKPLKISEDGKSAYCQIPHGDLPNGKKDWYRVSLTAQPTQTLPQTPKAAPVAANSYDPGVRYEIALRTASKLYGGSGELGMFWALVEDIMARWPS